MIAVGQEEFTDMNTKLSILQGQIVCKFELNIIESFLFVSSLNVMFVYHCIRPCLVFVIVVKFRVSYR